MAKLRLEADEQPITPFTVKQAYDSQHHKQSESQKGKEMAIKAGKKTIYRLAEQFRNEHLPYVEESTKETLKISINQFLPIRLLADSSSIPARWRTVEIFLCISEKVILQSKFVPYRRSTFLQIIKLIPSLKSVRLNAVAQAVGK